MAAPDLSHVEFDFGFAIVRLDSQTCSLSGFDCPNNAMLCAGDGRSRPFIFVDKQVWGVFESWRCFLPRRSSVTSCGSWGIAWSKQGSHAVAFDDPRNKRPSIPVGMWMAVGRSNLLEVFALFAVDQ